MPQLHNTGDKSKKKYANETQNTILYFVRVRHKLIVKRKEKWFFDGKNVYLHSFLILLSCSEINPDPPPASAISAFRQQKHNKKQALK
jgi:hypothetical protein